MERHNVAKLIGAPPGYVGYEEGGQLTEAVRRQPYAVILLDEIEKAHPDVFNTLLQVLDDGRLTDAQGRTVDFRNTVVIMTSNIGSPQILEAGRRGTDYAALKEIVFGELRSHFRPEFLNRVDEVIVFHALDQGQIRTIAGLQIDRLQRRLDERRVRLEVTQEALDELARVGYDPVFGARPLRRAVREHLETPLAREILAGNVTDGDTVLVTPSTQPGAPLTFEVTAPAAAN